MPREPETTVDGETDELGDRLNKDDRVTLMSSLATGSTWPTVEDLENVCTISGGVTLRLGAIALASSAILTATAAILI